MIRTFYFIQLNVNVGTLFSSELNFNAGTFYLIELNNLMYVHFIS